MADLSRKTTVVLVVVWFLVSAFSVVAVVLPPLNLFFLFQAVIATLGLVGSIGLYCRRSRARPLLAAVAIVSAVVSSASVGLMLALRFGHNLEFELWRPTVLTLVGLTVLYWLTIQLLWRKHRLWMAATALCISTFLGSLAAGAILTWQMWGDFYGLTTAATMGESEWSANPYSETFWVHPDLAMWLLENTEFPYQRCSRMYKRLGYCGWPKINWATNGVDTRYPDRSERAYRIVRRLVKAGYPINEYDRFGYTPLLSILTEGDLKAARILVEFGADPHLKVRNDGRLQGLDAYGVCENRADKGLLEFAPCLEAISVE